MRWLLYIPMWVLYLLQYRLYSDCYGVNVFRSITSGLTKYKLCRIIAGGTWYYVTSCPVQSMTDCFWTKAPCSLYHHVVDVEVY